MRKPVPDTTECVDALHPTEMTTAQSCGESEEKVKLGELAEDSADAGGMISIPGHPPFKWNGLMLEQ